ncbi:MAG: 3-phosphoshikimate 1-carboxyvinyltransferase [Planctomycetales bacterium]|nr:3-phosphoshikimate 1-carboxyvinyltransferase [Planctomycetales bacterium]
MTRPLPDPFPIAPADGRLEAALALPGSKSLTNRALVCAGLAEGESVLESPLDAEDTRLMREALRALGAGIVEEAGLWRVTGTGGRVRGGVALSCGNAGTAMRFLAAVAAAGPGPVTLDGTPRMRERPIGALAEALRRLGARIVFGGREGFPPLDVSGPAAGGATAVASDESSQFLSALLLAGPLYAHGVELLPEAGSGGRIASRPYADLTRAAMRTFGREVAVRPDGVHVVAAGPYRATRYAVEGDASAAQYPLAAAAIAGGRVRVRGLDRTTLQGDVAILGHLEGVGAEVADGPGFLEVQAPGPPLRALRADCGDTPDLAPTLAALCLFARGESRLTGLATLRSKESDRIAAIATECERLGAKVRAGPDEIAIRPGTLRGATIETYGDHRIAMAFALVGLRVPGVLVRDPGCVAKTYPEFWTDLERLRTSAAATRRHTRPFPQARKR